ncbi:NACHT domain-containing protein [Madurella fahalii]|uniref:NACHT domain-containing protein n=1 Tax=Madurella fahalii TaxID=1157608 RepID=A0ABQ0GGD5_9PEZI
MWGRENTGYEDSFDSTVESDGCRSLATLSVACNVMQVISFGLEAISLCKRVYERGHPEPELVSRSSSLHELATAIYQQLNSYQKSAINLKKDDKALLAIAARCADAANSLREEAKFLTPRDPKELRHIINAVTKTVWRKRRLERLEKELSNSQGAMETHLLARICTRAEVLARQNTESFGRLDSAMQDLVHRHATGSKALSDNIREEVDKVRSQVSEEASCTRHIIASASVEVRKDLSQKFEQLHVDDHREARHGRLLTSLKYDAMNGRTNTITERHPGTFQWIFQGDGARDGEHDARSTPRWPRFSTWLESDERLYWISGKPGSGKSTLIKFLVSAEETRVRLDKWRPGTRILSHFFWAAGTDLQKNIKGMLCSLLYQSLWGSTSRREEFPIGDLTRENEDDIEDLLQRFPNLLEKDSISDWSDTELREVIFSHLNNARPRCIILDGLDEVSPKDGPFKLLQLIDELRPVPGVKLCVASRPEHIMRSHLEKYPHLRTQDLTEPDIRRYVTTYLDKEIGVPIPVQYRHRIVHHLVTGAEGVFLWVYLVLRSLQRGLHNGDTWTELEERLRLMPTDLCACIATCGPD